MNDIEYILNLSPAAALAFVLFGLGRALKLTPINNIYIPFSLIAAGAVIYPFIADIGKDPANIQSPFIYRMVIGASIGCVTTSIYDAVRGFVGKQKTGDTQFINKTKNDL